MNLHTKYPALSDLRAGARRRIPHFVYEYLDSGTGVEDQMARNQTALRGVRFWPAILEGDVEPNISTTFLGRDYARPYGVAPVGMSGIMWPRAEKIIAAAAKEAGVPYAMSNVATVTPEDLTPYIGEDAWFQLYMPRDPVVRDDMLGRARAAGFKTLIVTVDVPMDSRRERQRRANLNIPVKVTPSMIWQAATHPEWAIGTLREGIPSLKFLEEYTPKQDDFDSVAHAGHLLRGQPSWSDIEAIRKVWDGPMTVKGVQKAEDAVRLAGMGVDAVWVSNHSGRQFDGGPASIDCLASVRDAIPDTPIIFDSGVQGGLDILRAVALGADFVMMGRAWHYSVGALGKRGPAHLIDILDDDMQLNMGQIGARTLRDLPSRLVGASGET